MCIIGGKSSGQLTNSRVSSESLLNKSLSVDKNLLLSLAYILASWTYLWSLVKGLVYVLLLLYKNLSIPLTSTDWSWA